MKVSIIMLTYNAPLYVNHSIKGIKRYTEGVDYELIVYDNASNNKTKEILKKLNENGYIDKLVFSEINYYFVGGNNRAVGYASEDAEYVLLLNSDIEIRNTKWLDSILKVHKRGITACQVCDEKDNRPDGWCLLVDKDLYLKYKLDEKRFTWFFSIADFGSRIMSDGYSVQSIRKYSNVIKHFGGASEISREVACVSNGMASDVSNWYPHKCEVVEYLDTSDGKSVISFFSCLNFFFKSYKIMKHILYKLRHL